jgi:hypothetical protein
LRTPLTTALNPDAREKLAVPTSYTVTNMKKSGKNLLGDRGKKKIYVEGKQSIAI